MDKIALELGYLSLLPVVHLNHLQNIKVLVKAGLVPRKKSEEQFD